MNTRRPPGSASGTAIVLVGLVVGLMSAGCGVDRYSRNLEFTHWHDDETVILVYTRERTTEGPIAPVESNPETVHARICTIEEDNSVTCRHQRRLTNMLNQHVVDGDEVELRDRWRP